MEASEKPQLPLDDGSVRAIDDRLVIERLEVIDERAARVVRERTQAGVAPAKTVEDAIEIGTRVLDREGLASEVDYVRTEFERAAGELSRGFGDQAKGVAEAIQGELERIFDADAGLLSRALDGHSEEIGEQIAEHFGADRSTAVQHQIKETVAKLVDEQLSALVRHFASDDAANPFADVKRGITQSVADATRRQEEKAKALSEALQRIETEIVRLGEQAEAKRRLAEAEEAGTRKGRSFEERVHEAIERIATARGDIAHRVGDERGPGGSKKGDSVIEIGACDGPAKGRIVFEDKDDQLSKNKAWEELNGAMAERDADFAVLVVAGEDKVPAGREQLVEYEGNKLIVAVDSELPDDLGLDLAYRYARLRVLLRRESELRLDAAGVRDAAEEARSTLKQAQSIRLALTGIDKSSEKARKGLDAMVAAAEQQLERIESLVSG